MALTVSMSDSFARSPITISSQATRDQITVNVLFQKL